MDSPGEEKKADSKLKFREAFCGAAAGRESTKAAALGGSSNGEG